MLQIQILLPHQAFKFFAAAAADEGYLRNKRMVLKLYDGSWK